jgi:hypothetical protein
MARQANLLAGVFGRSSYRIGSKRGMLRKFRQLGIVASAVASRATSIDVLVGMRVLQFVTVAPMLSLGAGSLAECYDAHERGLKVSEHLLLYGVLI